MKLLKDILYKAGMKEVLGDLNLAIESVHMDSREVTGLSLFVAVRGTQVDGHHFISQATSSGAMAVVCEKFPNEIRSDVTYVRVNDSSEALGIIASNYYDHPSSSRPTARLEPVIV